MAIHWCHRSSLDRVNVLCYSDDSFHFHYDDKQHHFHQCNDRHSKSVVCLIFPSIRKKTRYSSDPYACGSMIILNYTDFPGNDIAPSLAMNYTDCCNFCLNTSSCIAFTWLFNSNICYRKNSLGGGPVSLFNVISGRY